MGNPLAIGPSVMINRIVEREGTPAGAHLAKVAELRMRLERAASEQQAYEAMISPESQDEAPVIDNGAAVDKLI